MELKDHELEVIDLMLPSAMIRMNLYLNSGLVASTALREFLLASRMEQNVLSFILITVDEKSKDKNLDFENELYAFSQKIRCKSLMRFAFLLMDNIDKGSELADKFEREVASMQSLRISRAHSTANKAETKLCFPLTLLLLSLIIICIEPALMAM